MTRWAALVPLLAASAAAAQVRSDVEQIAPVSRSVVAAEIGRPGEAAMPAPAPAGPGEAQARQITSEKRSAKAPAQLSSGRPSAQPSTPLSRPSEGRTAAVTRVEGKDRCDPDGAALKPADAAFCARVLERRAAEFPPPRPTPLSPEQKLLAAQPADRNAAIGRESPRRLAGQASDPDAPGVQELAATLRAEASRKAAEDEAATLDANAITAAAALLQGSGGAVTVTSPPQE